MFICHDCAAKTGWPYRIVVSWGPCELCDRVKRCDDIRPRTEAVAGSLEQIRKERDERRATKQ